MSQKITPTVAGQGQGQNSGSSRVQSATLPTEVKLYALIVVTLQAEDMRPCFAPFAV